jgi:CRP-like cAMP-binding protein
MLTIEKVILLKSTDFFSTIDDDILAEVATTLEVVNVPARGRIIEAGDSGSSLYVVASGSVRVHDGAVTLRLLGPKEVFGDLSALDPDERTVSVTAAEDTVLLYMEHSTLMDVMEEHIEVAHGIIRFLVRRFRAGKA